MPTDAEKKAAAEAKLAAVEEKAAAETTEIQVEDLMAEYQGIISELTSKLALAQATVRTLQRQIESA